MVAAMEMVVLACDGVFDSGLAAILDVLDHANAASEQIARSRPGMCRRSASTPW
jgi:hypothetical protein